jgi:hypothetical protein
MSEDVSHVWQCKGHDRVQKWVDQLKSLEQSLIALNTDPILARIIISCLTTWHAGGALDTLPWVPNNYCMLLGHQDAQGWENFFMGLPSLGWRMIQHMYYQQLDNKCTGKRWLMAIIKK